MKLLKWLSVADRFHKIYLDRQLAPFGINSSQYMFLIKLCDSPGILQDSLMDMYYIHPSNIVRTIAALEKQGMLTRSPYDKDKRTWKLYPTDRALSAISEIRAVCEKTEELLLQGISETDKNLFTGFLMQAGKILQQNLALRGRRKNSMADNPLGYEKIPKLLKGFAIPSITATLVGSLYNIVNQVFIGQGVGYLGNAATNVSYPLSTICLAISLLIGIGSASRFSLYLGKKEAGSAAKAAGNSIILMVICGLAYLAIGELLLSPLLRLFGATTDVLPFAQQYAGITLAGMPFLIVTNGMGNLIRADGSPRYSMVCMVIGALLALTRQIFFLIPLILLFPLRFGVMGVLFAGPIADFAAFLLSVILVGRELKDQKHYINQGHA